MSVQVSSSPGRKVLIPAQMRGVSLVQAVAQPAGHLSADGWSQGILHAGISGIFMCCCEVYLLRRDGIIFCCLQGWGLAEQGKGGEVRKLQ